MQSNKSDPDAQGSGGYIRRGRHVVNFTILPNKMLQDKRLSLRQIGLLASILSRPENWTCRVSELSGGDGREGRDAVRTALRGLRVVGYVSLCHERQPDGTLRSIYWVFSNPCENDQPDVGGGPVRPGPEKPSPVSEPVQPRPVNPSPVEPSPVEPEPGSQAPYQADKEQDSRDKVTGNTKDGAPTADLLLDIGWGGRKSACKMVAKYGDMRVREVLSHLPAAAAAAKAKGVKHYPQKWVNMALTKKFDFNAPAPTPGMKATTPIRIALEASQQRTIAARAMTETSPLPPPIPKLELPAAPVPLSDDEFAARRNAQLDLLANWKPPQVV